jgi:thioredoxin reductase
LNFSAGPTEGVDLIVVGGSYAGCEAAITSARIAPNTSIFTLSLERRQKHQKTNKGFNHLRRTPLMLTHIHK